MKKRKEKKKKHNEKQKAQKINEKAKRIEKIVTEKAEEKNIYLLSQCFV